MLWSKLAAVKQTPVWSIVFDGNVSSVPSVVDSNDLAVVIVSYGTSSGPGILPPSSIASPSGWTQAVSIRQRSQPSDNDEGADSIAWALAWGGYKVLDGTEGGASLFSGETFRLVILRPDRSASVAASSSPVSSDVRKYVVFGFSAGGNQTSTPPSFSATFNGVSGLFEYTDPVTASAQGNSGPLVSASANILLAGAVISSNIDCTVSGPTAIYKAVSI
jgi:hypothetical protein